MGAESAATQASSALNANKQRHGPGTGSSQFKFPMSKEDAIRVLAPYLWEYEKREILEYADVIYFFNVNERVKNVGNNNLPGGSAYGKISEDPKTNHGFDTDTNEYIHRYNEHIGYRYEVVKKLGKGSFGIVLRVFDHKQ